MSPSQLAPQGARFINFESVPATLHRSLDWDTYFSRYSRERGGRAHVAKYSFNADATKAFSRLMSFIPALVLARSPL